LTAKNERKFISCAEKVPNKKAKWRAEIKSPKGLSGAFWIIALMVREKEMGKFTGVLDFAKTFLGPKENP
jgi:hypothetical protein